MLELVVTIITLAASWRIFQKMGRKGWEGIIPLYNTMCSLRSCTETAGGCC